MKKLAYILLHAYIHAHMSTLTHIHVVGCPSVLDVDTVCALIDESAYNSAVQSRKHTGAPRLRNDSLLPGLKRMQSCDIRFFQQRDADFSPL